MLQDYGCHLGAYDLVIVGDHLGHLASLLTHVRRALGGPRIAVWGKGRDPNRLPRWSQERARERIKSALSIRADGYLAYSEGVRASLIARGYPEDRVYTVANTIDLAEHRRRHQDWSEQRERLRTKRGLAGQSVLLFAGRLTRTRRWDYLVEAVSELVVRGSNAHLVVVGAGDRGYVDQARAVLGEERVTYQGEIDDDELASWMVLSDLFVFPGPVGFGALQALCYGLTPAVVDHGDQNPEFGYLDESNALVCRRGASPAEYAGAIDELLKDPGRRQRLRRDAWPSIRHLRIESTAAAFVGAVEDLLGRSEQVPVR